MKLIRGQWNSVKLSLGWKDRFTVETVGNMIKWRWEKDKEITRELWLRNTTRNLRKESLTAYSLF